MGRLDKRISPEINNRYQDFFEQVISDRDQNQLWQKDHVPGRKLPPVSRKKENKLTQKKTPNCSYNQPDLRN